MSTVNHNSVFIVISRVSDSCVTPVFLHSPRHSRSVDRSQHAASDSQHSQGGAPCQHNTWTNLVKTISPFHSLSTPAGGTGKIFSVCPVEPQTSVQPLLLPQQQPGWFFSPLLFLTQYYRSGNRGLLFCRPLLLWHFSVAEGYWYYLEQWFLTCGVSDPKFIPQK